MSFLSLKYILSQIFSVIMFLLLGISFYQNDRKKILILNIFAQLSISISIFLLNGYSGTFMSIVMLLCNIILLVKHIANKKITKIENLFITIILFFLFIIAGIKYYDGFISLFPIFATFILLIGISQENIKLYKLLGIIGGLFWLFYYNHLQSIFSVILQTLLIISTLKSYYKSEK